MSDELHRGLIGSSNRRKVRKHVGETWKPRESKLSKVQEPGIWCPSCQARHAYKNKKKLGTSFEKRSGVWHIIWYCIRSGDMVKDQPILGGSHGSR